MRKHWTKSYKPDYYYIHMDRKQLLEEKEKLESMLMEKPIRQKKMVGKKIVDDPSGPLLYPRSGGGYMTEDMIRDHIRQVVDLLDSMGGFDITRKKARQILAAALRLSGCKNAWSLAHEIVTKGATHVQQIDCSSLQYDKFVSVAEYYLETPVITKGYKVVQAEKDWGEIKIIRLRDGASIITENL